MAIIHDFHCAEHGAFEGSHAICPTLGCESERVTKIFTKPPGSLSASTKRFDQGIRRSAENMNISNWRSARAGESSKPPLDGTQVLWGNDVPRAMPGQSFASLSATAAQQAATPFTRPDGSKEMVPNNGMRQAATEIGITRRPLPQAERTVARTLSRVDG